MNRIKTRLIKTGGLFFLAVFILLAANVLPVSQANYSATDPSDRCAFCRYFTGNK